MADAHEPKLEGRAGNGSSTLVFTAGVKVNPYVRLSISGGFPLQAKDGAAERGLATAGFTGEAEDFAWVYRQADAIDRHHRRNRLAKLQHTAG